ncbi:hypothetical protein BDW67DRAFT_42916 [Aspergillus spinulosporus]
MTRETGYSRIPDQTHDSARRLKDIDVPSHLILCSTLVLPSSLHKPFSNDISSMSPSPTRNELDELLPPVQIRGNLRLGCGEPCLPLHDFLHLVPLSVWIRAWRLGKRSCHRGAFPARWYWHSCQVCSMTRARVICRCFAVLLYVSLAGGMWTLTLTLDPGPWAPGWKVEAMISWRGFEPSRLAVENTLGWNVSSRKKEREKTKGREKVERGEVR